MAQLPQPSQSASTKRQQYLTKAVRFALEKQCVELEMLADVALRYAQMKKTHASVPNEQNLTPAQQLEQANVKEGIQLYLDHGMPMCRVNHHHQDHYGPLLRQQSLGTRRSRIAQGRVALRR